MTTFRHHYFVGGTFISLCLFVTVITFGGAPMFAQPLQVSVLAPSATIPAGKTQSNRLITCSRNQEQTCQTTYRRCTHNRHNEMLPYECRKFLVRCRKDC